MKKVELREGFYVCFGFVCFSNVGEICPYKPKRSKKPTGTY